MVNGHTRDRRRGRHFLASAALIAAVVGAFIAPTVANAGSMLWGIVSSPNGSPGYYNWLQSVTCVTSSDCWAVGYYYASPSGDALTLIEQWNGASWSIVTSPNPVVSPNELYGVTCVSSLDCWAVGYYQNSSSNNQTLIEQWNGSVWSIVTSPNGGLSNNLYGVSCVSSSDCWAVGGDNTSTEQTLVEQWNGSVWSLVSSANTGTTLSNALNAVTCVTASDCWADGIGNNSGNIGQTLVEQWNGSVWSIVTSPNTNTTQENNLNGVTCVSSSDCSAVGDYYTPGVNIYQTLVEQWNGSVWSIVTSPNTNTAINNELLGVTCAAASDCWAVGFALDAGGYYQTLVEEWNGSAWSIVTSPNPSTTLSNWLYGVTCISASECWTVGYYDSSYNTITGLTYIQTLIEQGLMTCNGGSLNLTAPASATFPTLTLNGANQTSTTSLTFTPDDETGTGNGWNINVTSTTLVNGASQPLPTTASTVTGVASVAAGTGNCSLPTNTITSYPITVPAGASPPTAVPIYSANTGTGEGPSNVTLNFGIAVPGSAYSGTYSSTWTVMIASGP